MITELEIARLKELRIRREVATAFRQSGLGTHLAGWKKEFKEEIAVLENKLAETGRYMMPSLHNYAIVTIPND